MGRLFQCLRLPSLLGMLLTGVLLGPYLLNLIDSSLWRISPDLRQLALVVILLRAGLALDFRELRGVGRTAMLLCFVPACFEIGGMLLLAPRLLGISLIDAAIMGAVVAAVSPAVIVPRMLRLMQERRGTNKGVPQMIMAAASVDDVFVIVLFTCFTGLAMGQEVTAWRVGVVPIAILLGASGGLGIGWLLARLFAVTSMRSAVKVLVLLSVAFLLLQAEHWCEGVIPFSGLLSVMFVGVALLRFVPLLATRLSEQFSQLWVAAEVILFVLVGYQLDLTYVGQVGLPVLALVVGCMLVRMCGVWFCTLGSSLNWRERLFCMLAYLPKATIQAAIGGLPLAMGLPCGQLVLTVAVLSIVISAPVGAMAIDWGGKRLLCDQNDVLE